MGKASLPFGAYSKQQMVEIVKDRLRDLPGVIEERAVDLVARRVAGINGDVRRTLAVLREAVVLWNNAPNPADCVTRGLALQALEAALGATHMRVCPLHCLLLAGLYSAAALLVSPQQQQISRVEFTLRVWCFHTEVFVPASLDAPHASDFPGVWYIERLVQQDAGANIGHMPAGYGAAGALGTDHFSKSHS
ncbi:MAG: hypothetical protein HC767_05800 [Akkermansiaceae bacterium]|nr:hypothetical protein [Akkermansiaceae bacterium]